MTSTVKVGLLKVLNLRSYTYSNEGILFFDFYIRISIKA